MYTEIDFERVKELFAASFSRNPDVMSAIKDPSAALPTEYLAMDVSTVAQWMLSVVKNASTEAAKTEAKKAAMKKEDSKSRLLPTRFDHIYRQELHTLMVQAGGNALILRDFTFVQQMEKFLKAQTKHRVAAPVQEQMSNAS